MNYYGQPIPQPQPVASPWMTGPPPPAAAGGMMYQPMGPGSFPPPPAQQQQPPPQHHPHHQHQHQQQQQQPYQPQGYGNPYGMNNSNNSSSNVRPPRPPPPHSSPTPTPLPPSASVNASANANHGHGHGPIMSMPTPTIPNYGGNGNSNSSSGGPSLHQYDSSNSGSQPGLKRGNTIPSSAGGVSQQQQQQQHPLRQSPSPVYTNANQAANSNSSSSNNSNSNSNSKPRALGLNVMELLPELKALSSDELEKLLADMDALEALLGKLPMVINARKAREDVLLQHAESAKRNLALEPVLVEKRDKLQAAHIALAETRLEYDALYQKQQDMLKRFNIDLVLDRLRVAVAQADEQSEQMTEAMMSGDKNLDEFAKEYQNIRKLYHERTAKAEKLQALMDRR